MRVNEIAKQAGLSRRAVKFYEEKGLLDVSRDQNGYRNYSEENLQTLKEISVYRKLGIEIQDIKKLLKGDGETLLKQIYEEKKTALHMEEQELKALEQFIEDHDVDAVYPLVDYPTIGQAMQDLLPGFYGYYFMQHFQPFLQTRMKTQNQREAYQTIVHFWNHVQLRMPLLLWIFGQLMYRLTPKPSLERMTARMEETLRMYLHPTEEEYAALLEKTRRNVRLRNGFLKYHPLFLSTRRFMKRLQDCGYYDIFLPAMKELSPAYREYQEALMQMNTRICQDLGMYYDSEYRIIMKKAD